MESFLSFFSRRCLQQLFFAKKIAPPKSNIWKRLHEDHITLSIYHTKKKLLHVLANKKNFATVAAFSFLVAL